MQVQAPEGFATDVISLFAPIRRRKLIIGHQVVKADWIKLTATKPVNRNQ